MGGTCYLCGSKRSQDVSLHKFPKNPDIRQKWLQACNLSTDNTRRILICTLHFAVEDVVKGNPLSRPRLKSDAVPSKNIIKNLSDRSPQQFLIKDVSNKLDSNTLPLSDVSGLQGSNCEPSSVGNNISNSCTSNEMEVVNIGSEANTSSTKQDCGNFVRNRQLLSVTGEEIQSIFDEYRSPHYNRMVRYVTQIQLSDVATPRRAKRVICLLKDTDKKQSEKIKALEDKNRELQQQISTLEGIIARIKQ